MIHWRQGRFLTAGPAKSREPGSGGLSLQTADGSNSSQIGGGVLGSGEQLRLRPQQERETDRMETIETGEEECSRAGKATTG